MALKNKELLLIFKLTTEKEVLIGTENHLIICCYTQTSQPLAVSVIVPLMAINGPDCVKGFR